MLKNNIHQKKCFSEISVNSFFWCFVEIFVNSLTFLYFFSNSSHSHQTGNSQAKSTFLWNIYKLTDFFTFYWNFRQFIKNFIFFLKLFTFYENSNSRPMSTFSKNSVCSSFFSHFLKIFVSSSTFLYLSSNSSRF